MSEISSCLVRLRAETKAAHSSIEAVPALARVLSPDLTRGEYIAVIDAMHSFYQAIEPEIATSLESISQAYQLLDGRRPRSLVEDLTWLGAKPTRARPSIPKIETEAAGLGALYVIEGSGLGGRMIARRLADHLGLVPGKGASFYGGLSAETARARWQTLCEVLETQTSLCCQDNIVDSARATFDSLERWMRQVKVTRPQRSLAVAAVA